MRARFAGSVAFTGAGDVGPTFAAACWSVRGDDARDVHLARAEASPARCRVVRDPILRTRCLTETCRDPGLCASITGGGAAAADARAACRAAAAAR